MSLLHRFSFQGVFSSKENRIHVLQTVVLLLLAPIVNCVFGQQSDAPPASVGEVNLALAARASASYVSGDTSTAALHDGQLPRSSRDAQHGSYGNWPRTGTQWVEYEWSQPVSTKRMDIYWWDDRRGVRLPKAFRLLVWQGNSFAPVSNASGFEVAADRFNPVTFDEVTTAKVRLEMDSDAEFSTGILEWRVFDSGKSPDFAPIVKAGSDRVVILGGKTYLQGSTKVLKPSNSSTIEWAKVSGPGGVQFADAKALKTTAAFSAAGEYQLKLTAAQNALSSSDTLSVRVENPPPKERLDVVYTTPYQIDSPLWSGRAKAIIVNWIPHCVDQINRTDLKQGEGGIDNFVEAAKALRGEPHGAHKGYVFANAWVHQTVEAMCIALMIDPRGDQQIIEAQNKMRTTLEDWIPKILAAQEPDGYLQTAYTLADRTRWPERWSPRHRGDHEGYVAGYFIESAINHYTLTDGRDRRLYDAAKKLADCWVANIGPGKKEWYDGHQEMEQALVRFGRFVNDMEGNHRGDAYIQLAKFLLDSRKNGSEYDQSHVPVQQQYEAVGHAVRAVYSYSAMADVAAETGDLDYESAVLSLADNLTHKKYYVTGGIGSGETSEGFGPDYSLRQNAYCESCSSCGLIFFQYKLNLAYHDARYADRYEETIYNALLGSLDLDAKNFYYDNPLNSSRARYPWHVCPCCVGNIPRTLLMIPTWSYTKAKDGLYVNLFIGSTIHVGKIAGTELQVVQKTDYPWNGAVSLTLNPGETKKFALYVRIPNRSTSRLYSTVPVVSTLESLKVNGELLTAPVENGYAVIKREWKKGDKVDFVLPMHVQRIKSDERVAANQGRVALRYGPLIYNVERVDQPDLNQPLGPAPLTTSWRSDLLGGVTVIKGTWANGSPLLAVPNYARENRRPQADSPPEGRRRGASPDSIVWLKAE